MDGLGTESVTVHPAEGQNDDSKDTKDSEDTKDTKDSKNSKEKPKKQRVARQKPEKALPHAAADIPAGSTVDAAFFGKLGSTLRDLRREETQKKYSSFVVA